MYPIPEEKEQKEEIRKISIEVIPVASNHFQDHSSDDYKEEDTDEQT